MPDYAQSSDKPELRVLLARPRGFCAGVVRAIEVVEGALRHGPGPVYVRHEIVHNRHVVEALEAKGAVFVEQVADIPDGAVAIFSAHGVAKSVTAEAAGRGLETFDATCPLVSKVHREAQNHHRAGRQVLLIGHRGHPEVIGTMGQVPDGAVTLVEDCAQAESVAVPDPDKLAYTTQTTLSVGDTAAIVAILTRRFPSIRGPNKADICYATTNRQAAVQALAPEVDALIVVGAANSSNSKRLVEVARAAGCAKAFLVADAGEIDWPALDGVATLGLTAGASAPEVLVQGLLSALSLRFRTHVEEVSVREEDVHFSIPKALMG
ncbi:MAG: 4-hydroxy-3-methylbut-2-enyl diphosphate reductase [Alphaproteobacteria bacterium]|nr:MAG: 4-hydroxy-3-methylbut-2-enyl diphosphate reductase [Alphaproteobacteria bacterium]